MGEWDGCRNVSWLYRDTSYVPLGDWKEVFWKRWHLIECLKMMTLSSKSTRKVLSDERTAYAECRAGETDQSLGVRGPHQLQAEWGGGGPGWTCRADSHQIRAGSEFIRRSTNKTPNCLRQIHWAEWKRRRNLSPLWMTSSCWENMCLKSQSCTPPVWENITDSVL